MPDQQSNRTVSLVEYDCLYCGKDAPGVEGDNWLPKKDFEQLSKDMLDRSDETGKAPLLVRSNYLKAASYVGAIITSEGTRIEVFPKIDFLKGAGNKKDEEEDKDAGETYREKITKKEKEERIRILIEMLNPYLGRHHRQFEKGTWGDEELSLLEAFIGAFLKDVQNIVHRGLARAYIQHTENLPRLKGKLDFPNHIRYNLFHKERFYVIFDEFSIDRPINRVIKRALREVVKITRSTKNYQAATRLLAYFEEVQDARDWRHEANITKLDRSVSSDAYEHAFSLAQLILRELSPDNWSGDSRTISLLFPMERVFECYVAARLEEIFNKCGTPIEMRAQSTQYKIMQEEGVDNGVSFTLMPDIVARHKSTEHCVILDTKWKRLDSGKRDKKYDISQADIYQLYSYGKVYQREEGKSAPVSMTLLYPLNENFTETKTFVESQDESIKNNFSLKIVPVDIKGLTADEETEAGKEERNKAEEKLLEESLPADLYGKIEENRELESSGSKAS